MADVPDGSSAGGRLRTRHATAAWLDVWLRAVVMVAARRAAAVWVGAGIVAAVVFGPTGMQPRDLTGLALHHPGVGAALAVTWLLVFLPATRILVRADAASYLRALPAPVLAPRALAAAALIVLQLPWLALWTVGDGARGLAIVAGETALIVALARVPARRPRAGWPGWRRGGAALRAIHRRALRRRAGDALIRGAGLAILAGLAAGLFVRNNEAAGAGAAVIGAAVIAIVLVPALAGALLVVLETHRATAWLAATLGLARGARIAAVIGTLLALETAGSLLAVAAAAVVARGDAATVGWLAATSLAIGAASALGCARVLLGAEDHPSIAARVVAGAVVVAAGAVLCLAVLGLAGIAAFAAACAFAALGIGTR